MFSRCQFLKIGSQGAVFLTTLLLALPPQPGLAATLLSSAPSNNPTVTPALPPLILSGRQSDHPAGQYSAGITEILKMLDAKIAPELITNYIGNSRIAYDPDPAELIALNQRGASSEILLALQQHGQELKLQLAQLFWAANSSAATPSEDDSSPELEPLTPETSTDFGDPGAEANNYDYGYPGYGYYRPWLWTARRSHRPGFDHVHHHQPGDPAAGTGGRRAASFVPAVPGGRPPVSAAASSQPNNLAPHTPIHPASNTSATQAPAHSGGSGGHSR